MTFNGDSFLIGLLALALLPVLGWRIWRAIRSGQIPLYKTRINRDEAGPAKFNTLLVLNGLLFLLVAFVAVDLLFGLGLKERLLG
jgi:hypothetical protein